MRRVCELKCHQGSVSTAIRNCDWCIDDLDIAFFDEDLASFETQPFYVFFRYGFASYQLFYMTNMWVRLCVFVNQKKVIHLSSSLGMSWTKREERGADKDKGASKGYISNHQIDICTWVTIQ